jgi:hypothetical protein
MRSVHLKKNREIFEKDQATISKEQGQEQATSPHRLDRKSFELAAGWEALAWPQRHAEALADDWADAGLA